MRTRLGFFRHIGFVQPVSWRWVWSFASVNLIEAPLHLFVPEGLLCILHTSVPKRVFFLFSSMDTNDDLLCDVPCGLLSLFDFAIYTGWFPLVCPVDIHQLQPLNFHTGPDKTPHPPSPLQKLCCFDVVRGLQLLVPGPPYERSGFGIIVVSSIVCVLLGVILLHDKKWS